MKKLVLYNSHGKKILKKNSLMLLPYVLIIMALISRFKHFLFLFLYIHHRFSLLLLFYPFLAWALRKFFFNKSNPIEEEEEEVIGGKRWIWNEGPDDVQLSGVKGKVSSPARKNYLCIPLPCHFLEPPLPDEKSKFDPGNNIHITIIFNFMGR